MPAPQTRDETSAGGVVYRLVEGAPRYLLIRDSYKNWGFPKGHLKRGEAAAEAALRETREETGLATLALRGELGSIDWWFRFRGRRIHKICHSSPMAPKKPSTRAAPACMQTPPWRAAACACTAMSATSTPASPCAGRRLRRRWARPCRWMKQLDRSQHPG